MKILNCASDVTCFFYKGPNVEELEPIGAPRGWKKVEDIVFTVEGTEGRRLLGYKKNVPRGTYRKIVSKKNSLVRLTELT